MDSQQLASPLVEVSCSEIGEMTAGLPILNHRYVQLDRGAFQGNVQGVPLSEGLFWRTRANLGGYGTADIPPGFMLVALAGTNSKHEHWHGRRIDNDSIALANHRTGLEHRAGPGHESLAWLIPMRRYSEEAGALGLEVPAFSGGDPVVATANGRLKRLRAVIDAVSRWGPLSPDEAQQATRWFDAELVSATVECLAELKPARRNHRSRPGIAQAARDLIHAHVDRPLTLSELCRRLDVQERTLRHQFLTTYQCSPMDYQLALRLKLVQQRLRHVKPEKGAISKAATAFGFWHMGRFTAYYKRLLGECPSQTLAASSQRGAGGARS
jgi:AraC family ethanolamine operon transcriptional activator